MKDDKTYLRSKFLLERKKKYFKVKNFNFNSIFKLIENEFKKKKILISSYYT